MTIMNDEVDFVGSSHRRARLDLRQVYTKSLDGDQGLRMMKSWSS